MVEIGWLREVRSELTVESCFCDSTLDSELLRLLTSRAAKPQRIENPAAT